MNTITTKTNRELFLEKLAPYINETDLECVYDAYMFAKYAHRGQNRTQGERYFEHPRAVAEIIIDELGLKEDWRLVTTALLHDVLEDTWLLTPNVTRKVFGNDVVNWLSYLIREEAHSPDEFDKYIEKIAECGIWQVVLVKLCDRLHNLRTMETLEVAWCKKYLEQTEKYFYQLAKILIRIIPQEIKSKAITLEQALISEIHKQKVSI